MSRTILITSYLYHCVQGNTLVPESWRMFHSIGGQVEYTISLGRALQDLLRFLLDKEELRENGYLPIREQEEEVNDLRVDPVVRNFIN